LRGFGLPPPKAIACGTPVLCVNSSSSPEIIGDGGILVEPLDGNIWPKWIQMLLEDEKLERRTIEGRD